MAHSPTAIAIGATFATKLRAALSPTEWEEMRQRNATSRYAEGCASHDFCDSNMVMAEAFEAVMGRSALPDDGDEAGMTEADCDLWNAAWSYAKASILTAASA